MNPDEQTPVLLRALVALQIAERQERLSGDDPRATEIVLADAGLGLSDIAELTGRKYDTVKTTIRRARAAHAKAESGGKKTQRPADA